MILTDREIQIALSKEQIKIIPEPSLEQYSSTSVDLTLAANLSVFAEGIASANGVETVVDPGSPSFSAEKALAQITEPVVIPEDGFLLHPRKLVLGWTVERVELPTHSRVAARVEGKSSLARLGIGIHVTAPTIHSGFAYPIRLEIINHGHVPVRLRSKMRICQLIFEITLGTAQKGFSAIKSAPLPDVA